MMSDLSRLTGLPYILSKAGRRQSVGETRSEAAEWLRAQSEPITVDPDTMKLLADLLDPDRRWGEGKSYPDPNLAINSYIVAEWWPFHYCTLRDAGASNPATLADKWARSLVSKPTLEQIKKSHKEMHECIIANWKPISPDELGEE